MPSRVRPFFTFSPYLLPFLTRSATINKKDLIRHGKNHHVARQQDADSAQQQQALYNQAQRQQRDPPQQQQAQQQAQQHIPMAAVTSPYQEHVEFIVQEEREAKSKMPNYKGLENFKLSDKMGE